MASHFRNLHKSVILLTRPRFQKNFKGRGGDDLTRQFSVSQMLKTNHIYSAVCVERVPVITSMKSNLEQQYSDFMSSLELENSKLSDHEVRHIKENILLKKQKETEETTEGDAETETALDLEDKWDAELKKFELASRITTADKTNDMKSTERRLDSSLYLLVKQNIEGKDHWVLPQVAWEQGETMKQSAERALKSVCGEVQATFLGNAPCAVAKFDLPAPVQDEEVKLFFYKAWYRNGNVTFNNSLATDYLWVTKKELSTYCYQSYKKQVKKFLL